MKSKLLNILFFLICFILIRQVPLKSYSWIMNLSVGLFFLIQYKNFYKSKFIMIYSLWVVLLICYSLLKGNEIVLVIRFAIIILLLNLTFFIDYSDNYLKIFKSLIIIQMFFLIFFELYMIKNYNSSNYSNVRNFFQKKNYGDVYTYNGEFWKIQILGNALLPFYLYLNDFLLKKKKRILLIFNIFSILIAGNFAYIVSTFYYYVGIFFNSNMKKITKITITLLSLILILFLSKDYLTTELKRKNENSNPIKIEQVNILIDNIIEKGNIFLGTGLGNKIIKKGKYRNYIGEIYYELQGLYVFNQLGIINFSLLILIHFILLFYFIKNRKIRHIYISYLISGLFNPYIFDTNHIVVLIILVSKYKKERVDKK